MPKKVWKGGKEYAINTWGGATATGEIDPDAPSNKRLRSEDGAVRRALPMEEALPEGNRKPVSNMQDTAQVEAAPQQLRIGGPSNGGNAGAHETPIINVPPQIGFRETHTTIIPTTFYLSFNDIGGAHEVLTNNKLELRMNSPYNPVITPTALVTQTGGAARGPGWSTDLAPDSSTNTTSLHVPPFFYTVNHKPKWLTYWEKMYQVYTVLETKYEIVLENARTAVGNNLVCLHEDDQYGASSTGNVMPDADYGEMSNWPGTKEVFIGPKESEVFIGRKVISGVWKPGQNNRNVVNDNDYKTWNATGAIPSPAYVEAKHLRFFSGPMHTRRDIDCHVNMRIRLWYTVQFKDLQNVYRYPITGGTAITQTVPTEVLQTK